LGFGVQGLRFRVSGSGCRVLGLGFNYDAFGVSGARSIAGHSAVCEDAHGSGEQHDPAHPHDRILWTIPVWGVRVQRESSLLTTYWSEFTRERVLY